MAKEATNPSGKPTSVGYVPLGQQTARNSDKVPTSPSPMRDVEDAPVKVIPRPGFTHREVGSISK